MRLTALFGVLGALVVLGLTGCKKPEIEVASVPKPAARPSPERMPAPTGQTAAAPATPTWKVPPHWEAQALSNMRKGSWLIKGSAEQSAEMTVLVFPGDVGGDLANVNRWCSQISAPTIDEATLAQWKTKGAQTIGSAAGFTVYLEGASEAVYGAIVPVNGQTWFFKLKGAKALVQQERAQVDAFLSSVNFTQP